MKIALAQINPTIGDFENNLNKIFQNISIAEKQGAKLIIFSELALCGYPPKDLLLKKQFIEDNKKYLKLLAEKIKSDIAVIVGFAEENKGDGKPSFNSLAFIQNGEIKNTYQKILLPTYDVFDEDRYFEGGGKTCVVKVAGKSIGLSVCEDIWHDSLEWTKPRYHLDPMEELTKEKIDLLVNSSSSPYFIGKPTVRENILKQCAKKYSISIIYVNQVGGNDDLIFDGNSCVVDKDGNTLIRLKSFEEDLQFYEINDKKQCKDAPAGRLPNDEEELLQAIICGLRDYVRKCGFKKVIIGLSGGIDSALTATLAVYARTATDAVRNSRELAHNLMLEAAGLKQPEPSKVVKLKRAK